MNNYLWTRHSEWKMREYGLSQQRIKRVIRNPDRVEKSIVPGMVAAMQIGGTSKHRVEIWTMYEIKKRDTRDEKWEVSEMQNKKTITQGFGSSNVSLAKKFREERRREFLAKKRVGLHWNAGTDGGKSIRVISAWKYPGESPKRDPIPAEILEEIRQLR
jgi:hypothetical protein